MHAMNIGKAAEASGVSAKMIRHYEQIGLLPKARRTMSGYRTYGENDVHALRFIRQARDLGFSTTGIGALLDLWRDRRRPSSKVKALAQQHVRELHHELSEMQSMRATLVHLVHGCHGDDRPECPILESLSAPAVVAAATKPPRPAGTLRQGRAGGAARAVR